MATTRETLSGRMTAIDNPERRQATRRSFLWAVGAVFMGVTGHAAFLVGNYFGDTIVRL